MLKGQKGITLVALVVTIVVLIILAAVSITLVLGDNGIVKKAKEGTNTYKQAAANEEYFSNDVVDYINSQL
jgi:type II secretory pathway pseudopilin PulG